MSPKTSSRYRPPVVVAAPRRRKERVAFEAFVVDAPAWNATWAAVVVVAVVAWVLGAWLLPALGIKPVSHLRFVPDFTPIPAGSLLPEPLEQQRYLLTLLAALAVVPVAMLIARRRALDVVTRFAPVVGLVAILAVGTVAFVRGYGQAARYFGLGTWPVTALVVVVACGVAWLVAGRSPRFLATVDRASLSRPGEALVFIIILLLAVGVASAGVYTDGSILLAPADTAVHVQFTFEEATAVFYGHTPLVDFTPQYSALLSWLLAPFYLIFAPSIASFTVTMALLGVLALACLYVTFRLVTGTPARAFLLYLLPVAIGFVVVQKTPGWNVHTIAAYFALMPIRFLGPLALGLATIAVTGATETTHARRNTILLGAAAAATILLNVEFGVFAVAGAVLAAVTLSPDPQRRLRRTAILAAELLAGGVAVVLAFTLLTLAGSGSLPEFGQLFYFQRQFAAAGFFMLPLDHLLELHTLVFATFAAAATAGLGIPAFGRTRPGVHGRRSAALLTYSGVFGFGAFEYYMGRTHPDVLSATFLPWGIALSALCWEAGCRIAAGGVDARALRPATALLVTAATVLGAGGLGHLGYAVQQPGRIAQSHDEYRFYGESDAITVARDCLPRGANTMIFTDVPDRVAHATHIHNWFAYANPGSVVTTQQIDRVFDVGARHHANTIINQYVQDRALTARGFVPFRRFAFAHDDVATIGSYTQQTTVWVRRGTSAAADCHGAGKPVA